MCMCIYIYYIYMIYIYICYRFTLTRPCSTGNQCRFIPRYRKTKSRLSQPFIMGPWIRDQPMRFSPRQFQWVDPNLNPRGMISGTWILPQSSGIAGQRGLWGLPRATLHDAHPLKRPGSPKPRSNWPRCRAKMVTAQITGHDWLRKCLRTANGYSCQNILAYYIS